MSVPRLKATTRLLCGSGVIDLRSFWKLSTVNKAVRSGREESASVDLGRELYSLNLLSERADLHCLVLDCIKRDDAQTLQRLRKALDVDILFPNLFTRALEAGSRQCIDLLGQQGCPGSRPFLSPTAIQGMSKDTMALLLDRGLLHPNDWVERLFSIADKVTSSDDSDRYSNGKDIILRSWQSLLSVAIAEGNFDCAELLLDRGARVDLAECACERDELIFGAVGMEKRIDGRTTGPWKTYQQTGKGSFCQGRTALHELVLKLGEGKKRQGKRWMGEVDSALSDSVLATSDSDSLQSSDSESIQEQTRNRREEKKRQEVATRNRCLSLLGRLVGSARESKCLDWTCRWHSTEEVEWRLADMLTIKRLNYFQNHCQTTALGLACYFLDSEAIDVLLSAGAKVNWPSSDFRGRGGVVQPLTVMAVRSGR
uniref:Uncharacterized protein n=1 Tax=Chromera velia CCMP2878 TaxID=1169474 RepID=A0A0G4I3D6_9ALVE|eukprot:Cvel_10655.t1-p1 / transcript=Cvel_10655.t1 / gene=Cvel_10655 / organism=Chromera_velia_CCMP2878 / gene_product=hypothetical protein / transcript_product=hypothetical protein / location=Cvel_scaffold647:52926-54203(+) / protein_length=426 / sequence_SO=supercontig / SO=protein_coding / is_pseudo=false